MRQRGSLSPLWLLAGIVFAMPPSVFSGSAETGNDYERDVSVEINPLCPTELKPNMTLVHVKARGRRDVLHHLWSMEGVPTFLYARTGHDCNLKVDWKRMLSADKSRAIAFNCQPSYLASVSITKFIMYDDVNDTATLPPAESGHLDGVIAFEPRAMEWKLALKDSTNQSASAAFRLVGYNGVRLDDSVDVEIVLTTYGTRERSGRLPHLMHTENATQVDVVLGGVPNPAAFANGRLALELVTAVSEPPASGNFSLTVSRSLDDEYTPGVFKLMEFDSPQRQHYVQWRPVCYTSTERNIGDSTAVDQMPASDVSPARLDDSLVGWLATDDRPLLLVQGLNVTFGVQGDGFYGQSNYTSWTMVSGHGRPSADRFSLMVLLVIALGLGLPVLVLLAGGLVIAFRSYRRRKDDLLLSEN